jgi:hypothetical protein
MEERMKESKETILELGEHFQAEWNEEGRRQNSRPAYRNEHVTNIDAYAYAV